MHNLHSLDRFARLLLGGLALELAFFWLAGGWQIAAYLLGAVLIVTAVLRFCPLYRLLGLHRHGPGDKAWSKRAIALGAVVLALLLVGGAYASAFFTRKLFLEDFNAMNHHYKQTLFWTGQQQREQAIANYESLRPAYQQFQDKYSGYQPWALRGDPQFRADLTRVSALISAVGGLVRTGDLHQAHLDLEQVRPVFQDIFKRNGFSMLAVALVDFHDAMELMLDAAQARKPETIMALYPQVSEKLQVVEEEAHDAEIQAIRQHLDDLHELAKNARHDQLPAKGEALKSSFVKVYLKRG